MIRMKLGFFTCIYVIEFFLLLLFNLFLICLFYFILFLNLDNQIFLFGGEKKSVNS